ncbi:putative membrane protein, partial [Pseudomonas coronafaciens pv. oryzae]
MLWICLLVGGALLGYSLSYDEWAGALIGAIMGMAMWAGIRVRVLGRQSADHLQQLLETRKSLDSVQQRLSALERKPASIVSPAQDSAPLPADAVILNAPTQGPELIWDLPDEALQVDTPIPHIKPAIPPRQPPAPASPNLLDSAIGRARDWLLGGNTVLRVGVVVLFLGLAFLLRYATEGMVVPIEARYAGVALSALALLGLGWWLRLRNGPYALMLQGAGIGVLYLTIFAAMKLHALLDPTLGFALLVAITCFSAVLALTQNSLALASAGALGGFAAPILASTGQGSHVSLFSYFALLNAGIFAIAWFKAWRILNLIGFFGTFGIGFAWGMKAYTPELFWSTEPFLILFFLMYLAIGLLFARQKLLQLTHAAQDETRAAMLRWSARQGDYVDGTLLFGTPIAGFGLQYALVEHMEFGGAFSALALGLIYMGLARWLAGRTSGRTVLLMETCLALGVVFATLAIPLGLGSQWTTSAWAVEGAAVLWLGLRQQRRLAQAFGLLLQVGASAILFSGGTDSSAQAFANDYWTPMVLAIAAMVSAWCVFRFNSLALMSPVRARKLLIIWGAFWWLVSLAS